MKKSLLPVLVGGCTLKKTNTAVVVGIYGEGVPHGGWLRMQVMLALRVRCDGKAGGQPALAAWWGAAWWGAARWGAAFWGSPSGCRFPACLQPIESGRQAILGSQMRGAFACAQAIAMWWWRTLETTSRSRASNLAFISACTPLLRNTPPTAAWCAHPAPASAQHQQKQRRHLDGRGLLRPCL